MKRQTLLSIVSIVVGVTAFGAVWSALRIDRAQGTTAGKLVVGEAYAATCSWSYGSTYFKTNGCGTSAPFYITPSYNKSAYNSDYVTLDIPGTKTLMIWDNLFVDQEIKAEDNSRTGGSRFVSIGDDVYLTDLDISNMLGVYGRQDSTQAMLQLGSGGAKVRGYSNGDMCLGKACY
jgi:ABC-type antimicrobial peptide transport system permease subunit